MLLNVRSKKEKQYYLMVGSIATHQALCDSSAFRLYADIRYLILAMIFGLAILQALRPRRVNKEYIAVSILMIFSIYTSIEIGTTWLIYLFLIILFSYKKDIKKIIRCIIVPSGTVYAINYIIFLIRYLFDRTSLEHIIQYGTDTRYFMFYNSPNGSARILIFLVLGIVYLKDGELRTMDHAILGVISIMTYYFTHSDALILVVLILILFVLRCRFTLWIDMVAKYAYWMGAFISGAFMFLSSTKIFDRLDHLLVGRLSLSLQTYEIYGASLFGQSAELGYRYLNDVRMLLICDNSFYYMAIRYGLVYLMFISYLMIRIRRKDFGVENAICVCIYSLYMLIENRIFDLPSAFPLVVMAWYWLNRKTVAENKNKNLR